MFNLYVYIMCQLHGQWQEGGLVMVRYGGGDEKKKRRKMAKLRNFVCYCLTGLYYYYNLSWYAQVERERENEIPFEQYR